MKQIVKEYNFTLETYEAKVSTWGTGPKSNCSWVHIECFEGVYYKFATGDYDLATNLWAITFDRSHTTSSLMPILETKLKLFLDISLLPEKTDWSFYFRPFSLASWILIVISFIIFLALNQCMNYFGLEFGCRITSLLGWLLYTLLFAYYSGAQTMFLTTPPSIPLKTISDVLQNSEWTLLHIKGYDLYLEAYASEGQELFIDFKNRIEKGNYQYSFESVKEAIEVMQKIPGTVVAFPDLHMKFQLDELFNGRKTFYSTKGDSESSYSSGILTKKHWPLRQLFNKLITKQIEAGILNEIKRSAIKNNFKEETPDITVPISFLDVFTSFGLFLLAWIVCLMILKVEILYQ